MIKFSDFFGTSSHILNPGMNSKCCYSVNYFRPVKLLPNHSATTVKRVAVNIAIDVYYDFQYWNWLKARLPSVWEVSTRVEPTRTHKMGTCLGGIITLELDPGPWASPLKPPPGRKDLRIFPEEESHTRTLPSMLPVTSVSGAYSCRCRLFITLLSWHSCHRMSCFLVNGRDPIPLRTRSTNCILAEK